MNREDKKSMLMNKHLQGELTLTEQEEFSTLLAEDADFATDVDIAVVMKARQKVEHKKRWKQLIPEAKKNVSNEPKIVAMPSPRAKKRSKVFSIYRIAAVLLVFFTAFILLFWASQQSAIAPDQLAYTQFEQTDKLPQYSNQMGDNAEDVLKESYALYEHKKYTEALAMLQDVSATDEKYAEALVQKGMNQFQLKNTAQAIASFEAALKLPQAANQDKAQWFLALSYLADNQSTKAISILKEIVENEDTHWGKAKDLLENLK